MPETPAKPGLNGLGSALGPVDAGGDRQNRIRRTVSGLALDELPPKHLAEDRPREARAEVYEPGHLERLKGLHAVG